MTSVTAAETLEPEAGAHAVKVRSAKLHGLQVLRAVAALLVVFDHAILNLVNNDILSEIYKPIAYRSGAVGVYVFFVISGFIMAQTSRNSGGLKDAGIFLRRRIFRVVPLYWLATFIYLTRLAVGSDFPPVSEILQSLLFIPYFDNALIFHPVLGPGWTLNFEMYFYLIFAIGLLLPRHLSFAFVILFFAISILTGQVMGWQDRLSGPILAFATDPIIAYFLLGIIVHVAVGRLGAPTSNTGFPVVIGLSLIAVTVGIITFDLPPWAYMTACLMVVPLIVAVAARFPETAIGRPWKPAIFLGDASYSLYLSHSFVMGPMTTAYVWSGIGVSGALPFIAGTMLACSLFGVVCYLFVEKPLLRFFRSHAG